VTCKLCHKLVVTAGGCLSYRQECWLGGARDAGFTVTAGSVDWGVLLNVAGSLPDAGLQLQLGAGLFFLHFH